MTHFHLQYIVICFVDAFSLVSDSSGRMTRVRLDMFVQELLILPAAVFESPSFEYTEGIARTLFDQVCFLMQFISCIPDTSCLVSMQTEV